jgi:hypothetical protein
VVGSYEHDDGPTGSIRNARFPDWLDTVTFCSMELVSS